MPRWLTLPTLILSAAALLLVAGLMSRDCRIARVVLAGNLPDTVSLTLSARHGLDGRTILWRGPLGFGPILIPFAIPGDGIFEAKIEDTAGKTRVEEFGYFTPSGYTHYVFIGPKNVIHSQSFGGAFRDQTGEVPFERQLLGALTFVTDGLSCAEREVGDAFAPR